MADYIVRYTMVNGKELTMTSYEQPEKIKDYLNSLLGTTYMTCRNSDETHATVVNNNNVLFMEVTKK